MFILAISCLIFVLPYFLYGASHDALALTEEFGFSFNQNSTHEIIHQMKMKELCYENSDDFEHFSTQTST